MSEKKSNVKKRNWAFVVYPESAPKDWIEILKEKGLKCAISPLHDKDTDPDEKEKKRHWHVIACYEGPTTFNVVKTVTETLNSPIPQALESVRGYYRYLTHKDNPEKYQYDEKEIIYLNGFNISDYVELTKSEVDAYIESLTGLILENGYLEYSDFMIYLKNNGLKTEFSIARSNTIYFDRFITSLRHIHEKQQQKAKEVADRLRNPKSNEESTITKHVVTCEVCGEVKPEEAFTTYQSSKGVCSACYDMREGAVEE